MPMTRIGTFHFSRCEVISISILALGVASFVLNMCVLYFSFYPSYSRQKNVADAAMQHCARDPRHPACTSPETMDMAQSSPTTNSIWMAASMASVCWGKGCGHYISVVTGSIFNMIIVAFVGFVVMSSLGISIFGRREEMSRYRGGYGNSGSYDHTSLHRVHELDADDDGSGSLSIQMDGDAGPTRRR